ncbi:MAG: hypothetical protein ABEJ74_05725, partial [Haloferacaceae archaeon]
MARTTMHSHPGTPTVAAAPTELLETGHLWILEWVDGAHLRFQVRESGALRFGDRERVFPADDAPLPYRHAIRHVRSSLDRAALRDALADVESVTFFGVATQKGSIEYDWGRLPSFLGCDVWVGDRDAFLPPDATEQVFERLGLDPLNAVAREVRARDFDPDAYELPTSHWYDGPAAGVLLRNKSGGRARLPNPALENPEPAPVDAPVADVVDEFAPRRRFEATAQRLAQRGEAVTVDAVRDRVLEGVYREHHRRLCHGGSDVDP